MLEKIKEKLSKDGKFKAKIINIDGEEVILNFDIVLYSKFMSEVYGEDDFYIALDDYDLLNVTPISKVIEIL